MEENESMSEYLRLDFASKILSIEKYVLMKKTYSDRCILLSVTAQVRKKLGCILD